ncbi:MAG: ABC transporter permease subunit [Lachnospiraceae bacterium]|nr:ABC transporter permease subunit [Lachnospiraceae bacterium]
MRELLKLLRCEFTKLKHSKFLLIGVSGTLIVPFFVIVKAVTNYFSNPGTAITLFSLYDDAIMFLMLLFAPLVLTVLGAWTISREYTDGVLKNILVIPVSRTAFFTGKLLFFAVLTFLFMLVSWLEILVSAFLCSFFIPVTGLTILSCLFFLIKMLFGGILLCTTETPFIYLTIRTKGFVAPLTAVAVVSLVNVVLSNSGVAGFFPWSGSYLLVSRRLSGTGCPKEISISIILLMCLSGIVASLVRFKREEVE